MAIEDRRARDRAARRRLITTTARTLAEQEGWDAVTTRRLSAEIEYSQPVLYKHFSGMDGIVASVAVQGFGELADVLAAARAGAPDTPAELTAAFAELRAAVETVAGPRDPDTLAEVVWAALHGLVTLDRTGRLRPDYRDARIDLLTAGIVAAE